MTADTPFTLRFRDRDTHRLLRLTAKAERRSMNEIAEEAVTEYLAHRSRALEQRLRRTADLMRDWRRDDVEAAVQAFAEAEVEHEDPLLSERKSADTADPLGIGDLFADRVERG